MAPRCPPCHALGRGAIGSVLLAMCVAGSGPAAGSLAASTGAGAGAHAQQAPAPPERRAIAEAVEAIATIIGREYFSPDDAARVDTLLPAHLSSGRYDSVGSLEALARAVTSDLFDATHDKHLAVAVVPPAASGPVRPEAPGDARAVQARRSNYGVQRVEVLAGNVGHLNLTAFFRPEEAGDTIAAAMRALRGADALILDLRDNSGGSPDTAALVASYVFDRPAVPLFDIVPRGGTDVRRYATIDPVVADHDGVRPVYVLIASRTFSAGEGLAFILQEHRRAEIIGERTAGAANPGRPYPVNDRLEVTVPNGQVRTAITGRNWEGTGVAPDVATSAAEAQGVAYARALRGLLARWPTGAWHDIAAVETVEKQ